MQQEAEGRGCFSAVSVSQRHIVLCAAQEHISVMCLSFHEEAVKTIKTYKPYH